MAITLLNASVAVLVAAWYWTWATWPVNDNVAVHWSDGDWTEAAFHSLVRTGVGAALLFAVLLWANQRLLRPIRAGSWLAVVLASVAALFVVILGAAGVASFVRERPIF